MHFIKILQFSPKILIFSLFSLKGTLSAVKNHVGCNKGVLVKKFTDFEKN